jgi:acylglycerol lipase
LEQLTSSPKGVTMSRAFFQLLLMQLLIAALCVVLQPAQAKVILEPKDTLSVKANVPVYVWHDTRVRPKALVLAIHGLTMHGKVFEATARYLASQKFLVAAPDLRGYGSWYEKDSHCKTDYATVEKDLVEVAGALRKANPGVPLFVAGESLGGTAALRLAAHHPELVDGMILSAPALRYRSHFGVRGVVQIAMLATNPTRRIDTTPYVQYFSNDERIQEEELTDPLRKKRMGLGELISSCRFMSNSIGCVDDVPVDMPVLIMQGSDDKMVKPDSIALLEKKLKSEHRTVRWFPKHGHILLETAHVDKETLDTVSAWLKDNCEMRTSRTTAMAR